MDNRQELYELLASRVDEFALKLATEGVLDFEAEFTMRFRFNRSDMKNAYFKWWNKENLNSIKSMRKTRRNEVV